MSNDSVGLYDGVPELENKRAINTIHLVSFYLADEEYGINLKNVKEIINVGKITPVPQTPVHINGIINLRGNVISIMDMRIKFFLDAANVTEASRIIVVEKGSRISGLLVDAVSEVLHLPIDLLEPPPESKKIKKEFLTGVVNMEDRLIILLDVDKVMDNSFA